MRRFVNVSAANLYRLPTFHSEIDSQAVLWEEVDVIAEQDDFARIICEDSYEGWINKRQLADGAGSDLFALKMITRQHVRIKEKPDMESAPLRDAVAGSYVLIRAEQKGWLRVLLPDGQEGWLKKETCAPLPELNRENIIALARSFMGLPYYWAGKTPKGVDCSGFSQLVHKLFGIKIRRDASMQFEDARHVSKDPLGGQAGDLMFFSESASKITHVGFCLGQGKILHARGMVRINSLQKNAVGFDGGLLKDFVEIRSFIA